MDTSLFVEAIGKSGLPFVYSGNKLQDEKCQKALEKISYEGTLLGVITETIFKGGLAVTDTGIYATPGLMTLKGSKSNGAYPYDSFVLHDVTVTVSVNFIVEFTMYDVHATQVYTGKFPLMEDVKITDAMKEEMGAIFKTLVTKTGTEYVEKTEAEKAPNVFDFEWNNIHSVITLDDKNIVITKLRIEEKTKIQTPEGSSVTIPRSALESIKKGKTFSPLTLLKSMAGGIGMWIALGLLIAPVVGFIAFLLATLLGLSLSFPMQMIFKRKDGQKFSTRFYGSDKDNAEYERCINTIFK